MRAEKKPFPKAVGVMPHTEQLGVSLLSPPLTSLVVHQDIYPAMLSSPPCIRHVHLQTSKLTCPQRPFTAARVLEAARKGGTWPAPSCTGWDRMVEETMQGADGIRHKKLSWQELVSRGAGH